MALKQCDLFIRNRLKQERSPFIVQPALIALSPTAATTKTTTATASVIFTGPSFIDLEATTHPFSAVEFRNGFVFLLVSLVFRHGIPTTSEVLSEQAS
jgi:hypothetical protein